MRWIKLTALASFLFASLLSISSCERYDEMKKITVYSKNGIVMSGAQVVPASATTGTGTMDVSYDKSSKTLSYKLTWSGLSDSVIAIRICGPAPTGYSSLNPAFTGANPTLTTTTPYVFLQELTYNIIKGVTTANTANNTVFASSGSYSGTLLVDKVKVKEDELLNNLYYVTIHTGKLIPPAAAPASFNNRWYGEIRAQIKFQ